MTGTSAGSEHQAEHFERLYKLVFGNASLIERKKKSAFWSHDKPLCHQKRPEVLVLVSSVRTSCHAKS